MQTYVEVIILDTPNIAYINFFLNIKLLYMEFFSTQILKYSTF